MKYNLYKENCRQITIRISWYTMLFNHIPIQHVHLNLTVFCRVPSLIPKSKQAQNADHRSGLWSRIICKRLRLSSLPQQKPARKFHWNPSTSVWVTALLTQTNTAAGTTYSAVTS